MDTTLIIDRSRCAGTGVCLSIAAPHLRLLGDTATTVPGTILPIAQARAAALCCPQKAITVCEQPQASFEIAEPIVTLGPAGTDAQAEADKHSAQVRLVESFAAAMAAAAADPGVLALIAAGYLLLDHEDRTLDCWVDQHFTHTGVLRLLRCWEAATKPMCLAVHRGLGPGDPITTVATHPATRVFATQHAPKARKVSVTAKPLAAAAAARGEVDACIASVDVVAGHPELVVRSQFTPTMVWLLYRRRGGDDE